MVTAMAPAFTFTSRAFLAKYGACPACANAYAPGLDWARYCQEYGRQPVHADGCPPPVLVPVATGAADTDGTVELLAPAIPAGRYTVVRPDGSWLTLQIRTLDKRSRYAGNTRVGALVGPMNTSDYAAFGWVNGTRVRPFRTASLWGSDRVFSPATVAAWVAQAEALLTGDFRAAGLEYALRSNNCYRCGRALTVPASVTRGLGPECAGKAGY